MFSDEQIDDISSQSTIDYSSEVLSDERISCSKRCNKGCHGCKCAKAKRPCNIYCKCRNCENQEVEEDASLSWPIQSFASFTPQFNGVCGAVNFHGVNTASPLALFLKLWSDDIMDKITSETQVYAFGREKQFEYNNDDIFDYFLVVLVMGLCPLPSHDYYWNHQTTNLGLFGNYFIQHVMSKNKWETIHSSLHGAVKEILVMLNRNFKSHWVPFQNIAVDETLFAFKGKYSARQHVPLKPNSTGLKIWLLADETGYCYSFWLYEGKENSTRSSKPIDVLLDFAAELPTSNYIIYADSFFGSLQAAEQLSGQGKYFVLCCRSDRPSKLFSQYLDGKVKEKGQYVSAVNNSSKIVAVSYYDSKIVHFLSNCYGVHPISQKGRPEISEKYNSFMCGVDTFDASHNRHMYAHRKKKWTRCMQYNLFKMAIVNAWIIYNNLNSHVSQTQFIINLLSELKPDLSNTHSYASRSHILTSGPRSRCKYCQNNKIESKTV